MKSNNFKYFKLVLFFKNLATCCTPLNVFGAYAKKVIFIKMRQTEVSFLKIPKFRKESYPL